MLKTDAIYLGASRHPDNSLGDPQYLQLRYANRHGLITGATGTGKTVSLQVLAEGFCNAGVPVFAADIKGDLSGIAALGAPKDFLAKRAAEIGFSAEYRQDKSPTVFWDLFGEQGHPIRATVSDMGPLLLSRLLDLNPTQEGVLNVAFKLADQEGLLLLDLKDLQALLSDMGERAKEISTTQGNVTKPSIGAIQRQLLVLEQQGGGMFLGEPALEISDLMRTDTSGRGIVNVLAADKLMSSPRLYATFLLWLMSELFEELPEVGDPEKPRLVFFFDEAHLLFAEAPKALVEKVEQVVKLVRSKGVGIYFVTQNPLDVPDGVLAQLSNRLQHALRAFTPRDQKAVKSAADTFRPNPEFSVEAAITNLAVGEALVSTLGDGGIPSEVQRTLIRPPSGQVGPIDPAARKALIQGSPVFGRYEKTVDRESAYELLARRAQAKAAAPAAKADQGTAGSWIPDLGLGRASGRGSSRRESVVEAATKSVVRSVGTSLGRALIRGILGSMRR